jgi:hypothetical protein
LAVECKIAKIIRLAPLSKTTNLVKYLRIHSELKDYFAAYLDDGKKTRNIEFPKQ